MVSDPKPELYLPLRTPGPWTEDRYQLDPIPIDLSLPDQRVALIGPKGSGKSTLLRHLAADVITMDDTTPTAAAKVAKANPKARIFASAGGPIRGFTTREILPLSDRNIDDYLHHHSPDPYRLHHLLRSDAQLYELLRSPAILAACVRLANNGIVFPRQRAELYAWVLENLGPLTHPAIRAYREGTDFRLLAARKFRESGPAPVDGLVNTILDSNGGPAAIALLYKMETDLIPYGYRINNPRHREQVLAMTALFEDTPESAAVVLADKVAAAEALGRLGDPRLRLPADPAYWAPVGQGIELGRFPVTVYEFEAFVQATGYVPYNWTEQQQHPNRPVTGVGWHSAVRYCLWAGGHLPTAAEWESALAGKYPWGDQEPDSTFANTNELQLCHPTPVGLFPRGNTPETGIADLYGNIFEWVDEDVTRAGEIPMRGTRGASSRTYLSSPNGRWDTGEGGHENIGFRCARKTPSLLSPPLHT
jgi:energy-coupling factor transporter ATP-binding protein EcfA2